MSAKAGEDQFETGLGPVSLPPEPAGRYKVMFSSENLGRYESAEVAAGNTNAPSGGLQLGELGIPPDLSGWQEKLFATFGRLHPT